MPWQIYVQAHGNAAGVLVTLNNPAPVQTPPNPRSWKPALPAPRSAPLAGAITAEIALRGDHRTPAQVEQAGGLWSHLFQNPAAGAHGAQMNYPAGTAMGSHRGAPGGGPAGGAYEHQAARYDPHSHQAGPGQAPYVSFTRDIGVAKGFAGANGFVYLVRVNVGVDYNQYAGGNAMQAEVMALQGVALQDIIAVRRRMDDQILINILFQQAAMAPATFNAGIALLAS